MIIYPKKYKITEQKIGKTVVYEETDLGSLSFVNKGILKKDFEIPLKIRGDKAANKIINNTLSERNMISSPSVH